MWQVTPWRRQSSTQQDCQDSSKGLDQLYGTLNLALMDLFDKNIRSPDGQVYEVVRKLGHGAFGEVSPPGIQPAGMTV